MELSYIGKLKKVGQFVELKDMPEKRTTNITLFPTPIIFLHLSQIEIALAIFNNYY